MTGTWAAQQLAKEREHYAAVTEALGGDSQAMRAAGCLYRHEGIRTPEQLDGYTINELADVPGIGDVALARLLAYFTRRI